MPLSELRKSTVDQIGLAAAWLRQAKGVAPIIYISVPLIAAAWWRSVFSTHYQVDFSAYWNAGRAVLAGKSAYSFFDTFQHSEFLYPPIVADFFAVLALFDYEDAKVIWYGIQILCLVSAIGLMQERGRQAAIISLALLLGLPVFSWPLYAHLERGQIDLLTLFCITLSYRLQVENQDLIAGMALAAAGMFKLPALALFLIPLVHFNKRFLLGGILACAGLLIGTLILDGYEINFLYWTKYLPHIAKTGLLPPDVFDAKLTPHAEVITYQGKTYVTAQDFSVVTSLGSKVAGILLFLLALIGIIMKSKPCSESWLLIMLTVMLANPLTWLMQYVWILFIITTRLRTSVATLVGMALIGINDGGWLGKYRVLVGMALIIGSLWYAVGKERRDRLAFWK